MQKIEKKFRRSTVYYGKIIFNFTIIFIQVHLFISIDYILEIICLSKTIQDAYGHFAVVRGSMIEPPIARTQRRALERCTHAIGGSGVEQARSAIHGAAL